MPGQTASGFPYIVSSDPVINAPDTWEALANRLELEDEAVDVAIGGLQPAVHTHPDPILGIRQQYVALTATKGQSGYPGAITVNSGDGWVRLQPEGDGYITVEEDGVGLFSVYANAEGSAGLPLGTYLRFRFTREEFNGKPQDHTGYLDVEIKAGHNVITAHNWQFTTEAGRKYSVWVDVRREDGAASGSVVIESRQFKMHNIIVGAAAKVPGSGDEGTYVAPDTYHYFGARPDVAPSGASIYTGDALAEVGTRWILVATVDTTQGFTIGPTWEVLLSGVLGAMRYAVITKTFTEPGSSLIVSTGPETHSYNRLAASGFVLKGGDFRFMPVLGESLYTGVRDPYVPLTAYQGTAQHRLRAIAGRGFYNNWITPGSGHASAGYLTPEASWLQGYAPSGWQPIEPYFTATWPVGEFQHDSIGVAGAVTSQEIHIGLGPPLIP